jgi:phosphate-selective porin OprO and OprP
MRALPFAIASALATLLLSPTASAKSDLLEILARKGVITLEEYQELKAEQNTSVSVNTDDGFKLASKDSTTPAPPTFQIGTLQQLDVAGYADDQAALSDGSELRRSRLSVGGTFLTDWQYRVEYEFSGTGGVTDAYATWNGRKPLTVTVGQFKQPFGLEATASDKTLTFMERGLPFAFVITRAPGVAVGRSGANWSLNGGLFGEPVGNAQAGNDGYGSAARWSVAPLVSDTGVLHLGLGATWRVPTMDNSTNTSGAKFDTLRLRSKPESNILAQRLVDTGELRNVDHMTTIGLELAGSIGAASLQGEYQAANVTRHSLPSLDFSGWYVQAAYTLTGEKRPYFANKGVFDGIKPAHNFGKDGWGALEVALRFSGLDLTDGNIRGGSERNISAALNWYLNPYVRLSANVIKVIDVDGGAFANDEPTVFQARMQLAY